MQKNAKVILVFTVNKYLILKNTSQAQTMSIKIASQGPFIFYEVGGAGGIFELLLRSCMPPPQSINFSHAHPQ